MTGDQERSEQPGTEQSREGSARPQSDPRGGANAAGSRHRERRRHRGEQPPPPPRRPEPAINMEELRELFDLITAQGFTEFELEREGFRVRLRRDVGTPGPAHSSAHVAPAVAPTHVPAAVPAPAVSFALESAAVSPLATSQTELTPPVAVSKEEDLHVITSPIVGTFYRAPSPTTEVFVRVGSSVDPDTVVCIIEAMKLMNEIQAETTGVIEKIYVENGQPVEYGQALFGIKK